MNMADELPPEEFLRLGRVIMRKGEDKEPWPMSQAERRRYSAHFGCQPEILAIAWGFLVDFGLVDADTKPVYLLWACMLMKVYTVESVLCTLAGGVDEKKYRDHAWKLIQALCDLSFTLVSCVFNYSFSIDFKNYISTHNSSFYPM